jgi:hypothetical protein
MNHPPERLFEMNESKTKDKILKRIRLALLDKNPDPYPDISFNDPLFSYDPNEFPELILAEKFVESGGNFLFCETAEELIKSVRDTASALGAASIHCSHPTWSSFFSQPSVLAPAASTLPDIHISTCFGLIAHPCSMIFTKQSCFSPAKWQFIISRPKDVYFELRQGLQAIKQSIQSMQPTRSKSWFLIKRPASRPAMPSLPILFIFF